MPEFLIHYDLSAFPFPDPVIVITLSPAPAPSQRAGTKSLIYHMHLPNFLSSFLPLADLYSWSPCRCAFPAALKFFLLPATFPTCVLPFFVFIFTSVCFLFYFFCHLSCFPSAQCFLLPLFAVVTLCLPVHPNLLLMTLSGFFFPFVTHHLSRHWESDPCGWCM